MFDATSYEPKVEVKSRQQLFEEAPLWDKVRHALEDIETAERHPHQSIDMDSWIQRSGKRCSVCAGGAVMRNTYNRTGTIIAISAHFKKGLIPTFSFLDCARRGKVAFGLDFNGFCDAVTANRVSDAWRERIGGMFNFRQYHEDRDAWFRQMRCLADVLEEHKVGAL